MKEPGAAILALPGSLGSLDGLETEVLDFTDSQIQMFSLARVLKLYFPLYNPKIFTLHVSVPFSSLMVSR